MLKEAMNHVHDDLGTEQTFKHATNDDESDDESDSDQDGANDKGDSTGTKLKKRKMISMALITYVLVNKVSKSA